MVEDSSYIRRFRALLRHVDNLQVLPCIILQRRRRLLLLLLLLFMQPMTQDTRGTRITLPFRVHANPFPFKLLISTVCRSFFYSFSYPIRFYFISFYLSIFYFFFAKKLYDIPFICRSKTQALVRSILILQFNILISHSILYNYLLFLISL